MNVKEKDGRGFNPDSKSKISISVAPREIIFHEPILVGQSLESWSKKMNSLHDIKFGNEEINYKFIKSDVDEKKCQDLILRKEDGRIVIGAERDMDNNKYTRVFTELTADSLQAELARMGEESMTKFIDELVLNPLIDSGILKKYKFPQGTSFFFYRGKIAIINSNNGLRREFDVEPFCQVFEEANQKFQRFPDLIEKKIKSILEPNMLDRREKDYLNTIEHSNLSEKFINSVKKKKLFTKHEMYLLSIQLQVKGQTLESLVEEVNNKPVLEKKEILSDVMLSIGNDEDDYFQNHCRENNIPEATSNLIKVGWILLYEYGKRNNDGMPSNNLIDQIAQKNNLSFATVAYGFSSLDFDYGAYLYRIDE